MADVARHAGQVAILAQAKSENERERARKSVNAENADTDETFPALSLDHARCRSFSERIFDERAAYLLADLLSDNHARAGTFGLNSYLSFDFPVACKTGTSWYYEPSVVEHCFIDPLTGHRISSDHPRAFQEIYAFPPEPAHPEDYDSAGRVRLPEEYRAWVESDQNALGDLLAGSRQMQHLRILEPAAGGLYYLDRDLPASDQRLLPRADSTGPVEWSSETLKCRTEGKRVTVGLREGRHEIEARNTVTGETAVTSILVERW